MTTIFPWILAGAGVSILWMTGSGYRIGWLLGAILQFFWAYYAIATNQYGFLVECVAYFVIFARSYHRIGKLEEDAQQEILGD